MNAVSALPNLVAELTLCTSVVVVRSEHSGSVSW